MRVFTLAAAAAALAVAAVAPAFAGDKPEIQTGRFNNFAAGGYDVVSYFSGAGPVRGEKAFSTEYKGATFRFADQANLNAFLNDPAAFAPQYGGYCAWAASQGYIAPGDPDVWHVHDGKLYFNYNRKVQEDWLKDAPGFIAAADRNWPAVLSR